MNPDTNLVKRVASAFRKSHEDVEIKDNNIFVRDEELVNGLKEERNNRLDFKK
jgi:uncharacterized protein (DUF1800 family)